MIRSEPDTLMRGTHDLKYTVPRYVHYVIIKCPRSIEVSKTNITNIRATFSLVKPLALFLVLFLFFFNIFLKTVSFLQSVFFVTLNPLK